nr:uncharacterized protein LOC111502473 [Leptinotarsa decemlineata]
MLREFCAVFLVVAIFSTEIHGRPSIRSGLKKCFDHKCPENTFACSRRSEISSDKKEIVSEIKCLDLHNKVLDSVSTSEPNKFGPGVFFQGYSYTAAYEYSDDDTDTADEKNKDVGDNAIDSDKKESYGNSEVEDLNRDVQPE